MSELTMFGWTLFLTLFGFFIGIGITITNIKKLDKKCNSLEEANATLCADIFIISL